MKNLHVVAAMAALVSWCSSKTVAVGPPAEMLDANTFAVASVSLEGAPRADLVARVVERMGLPPSAFEGAKSVMTAVERLRELGAYELATALSIDDLPGNAPPPVVLWLKDGSQVAEAKELIEQQPWFTAPMTVRAESDRLWIGAAKAIDRVAEKTPTERPDLLQPLKDSRLAGAAVTVVVSPGEDSRRVIRELWPRLKAPFDRLDGRLVADGVRRLVLEVSTNPSSPGAALRLVADSEPTADTFIALAEAADAKAREDLGPMPAPQAMIVEAFMNQLKPKQEGAEVVLAVNGGTAVQGLVNSMLPSVQDARERARRWQKMNDMKQIGLAVLNFESVNGFLPHTICNEQGEPLLSWRVAILPYLEQQALFNKFHLDEPWDSPHNLPLAKTLPPVYFAATADEELSAQSRTTYLRPVYPGSDLAEAAGDAAPVKVKSYGQEYYLRPGDRFRQMIDGTSNTMMVAEVAPEHAVVWTKPDDWRVDLEDPLAKLRTDQREGYVTAFYDGSARFHAFTINADLLRKILTKAGGEVIDWQAEYQATK